MESLFIKYLFGSLGYFHMDVRRALFASVVPSRKMLDKTASDTYSI